MFLSPTAIVARLENRRAKLQERLAEARGSVAEARRALADAVAADSDLAGPTKALRKAEAAADELAAELGLTEEVLAEKRGEQDAAAAEASRKRLADVLAARQTAVERLQAAINGFGEAWSDVVQASAQLAPLAPSDGLLGHTLKAYTEVALGQATGGDIGRTLLGGTPIVALTQRAADSAASILAALQPAAKVQR